jgi:hypothetical protein
MTETAIIAALGQMGAAGILALAVLQLFNRLTSLQTDFRNYLIQQNTLLRDENRMLLLTLTRLIPGFAEAYNQNRTGTITNLDPPG